MTNATTAVPIIVLNGQDYIVLPLNWKQLKERREDIILINGLKKDQALFTEEQQDAIARVVHASLARTRSDIAIAFVEENLDLGNVGKMLEMVFGSAQNTKVGSGEV